MANYGKEICGQWELQMRSLGGPAVIIRFTLTENKRGRLYPQARQSAIARFEATDTLVGAGMGAKGLLSAVLWLSIKAREQVQLSGPEASAIPICSRAEGRRVMKGGSDVDCTGGSPRPDIMSSTQTGLSRSNSDERGSAPSLQSSPYGIAAARHTTLRESPGNAVFYLRKRPTSRRAATAVPHNNNRDFHSTLYFSFSYFQISER